MIVVQKYIAQFQKLCHPGIRVLVLAIFLIGFSVIFSFQAFSPTPGNGSLLLFPAYGEGGSPSDSSSTSEELGGVSLPGDSKKEGQNRGLPVVAGATDEHHYQMDETDGDPDDFDIDGEESQEDNELSIDLGNGVWMRRVKDPFGGYITLENSVEAGKMNSSLGNSDNSSVAPSSVSYPPQSPADREIQVKQGNNSTVPVVDVAADVSSSGVMKTETNQTVARDEEKKVPLQSGVTMPSCEKDPVGKKRGKQPTVTLSQMNQILLKNRGSPCSMRKPRWPSPSDQQIIKAKEQILNAPVVDNDPELYAPLFRNISMFRRSYELMDKMLKVYVYKEGDKPIFHQPHLTGIYASEGWFMKHMESSRHFVVDNPSEAHLFYIPFSSSLLRFHLYVPGSHSHRNIVEYLKNYVRTITTKYPFWNRTDGADHFLAACHDWAADETAAAMGNSIRALCNADMTEVFELGKDVSLPETYVRNEKDPLRDLGGSPAKKRPVLAFFAGKMHGYLRPILLQHWENKDPDMKVFGPLSEKGGGRRRKRGSNYAQYMKSSKYCICPRGYEVNSPRVVEAIFYGCVPVIISDNFVPPFFEVLNWEAFSVVVAEQDVPRLKDILTSIPRKKYLALQMGVRKVQQHFLWHNQPVKYDMFHMILHSVWFNRVLNFQM